MPLFLEPDCPGADIPQGLPLVPVACALLVNGDGNILVTSRPDGKDMAGLWEFPGGKIEAGESPEAALIRELQEELGIETSTSCLAPCGFSSHAYARQHILLLAFAIRKWRGTPRALEGQEMQWLPANALFRIEMPPADRPLLGQIAAIL